MAISDASGQVVWRGDYKPFGEEASVSGALANERKFVGKEKDEETGLYYFGARYLDAKIGRFAAVDPVRAVDSKNNESNENSIINPQRLNLYAYALNNPISFIDPTGLWGEDVHSGIGISGYGTYTWAMEVGFSESDARRMAISDAATDNYANWAPVAGVPGRHFNTAIGNVDTRDVFADMDLKSSIDLYKNGEKCKAISRLGRGLHSIQDKYAHMGWIPTIPHPAWYDDAKFRVRALAHTREATYNYINRFLSGVR